MVRALLSATQIQENGLRSYWLREQLPSFMVLPSARRPVTMRRYYFDLREGDDLAPDEEGLELPSIEQVQEEAARSLADMARGRGPDKSGWCRSPHGNRGPGRQRAGTTGEVHL
jgi:hypothetical protein